jgi:hypothetical protein
MTIKELMELTGQTRFNMMKMFLEDGIAEIQLITKENVTQKKENITAETSSYALPTDLVEVSDVKILDTDSSYYVPIPRVIIKNYKEK